MINRISYKLAKKLLDISHNKSSEEDIDIIRYGIECIINIGFTLLLILIFTTCFNATIIGLIWSLTFLLCREHFGGYHANTQFMCITISSSLGIITTIICHYAANSLLIAILAAMFSAFIECLILSKLSVKS